MTAAGRRAPAGTVGTSECPDRRPRMTAPCYSPPCSQEAGSAGAAVDTGQPDDDKQGYMERRCRVT